MEQDNLERELSILKDLDHPMAVKHLDDFIIAGSEVQCIIMQYVDGPCCFEKYLLGL